jgi:4-oxalocrotonate tautomerase
MPFVQVHMWEGRSVQDKRALVKAITDAMVTHAHAKPDALHVVIQEYPLENWARAGVLGIDRTDS